MKVLFTKDYGKEKFDKIRELGYEIMYYNENIVTNNEDVDSADILVTYNPFRTLDINKMENLTDGKFLRKTEKAKASSAFALPTVYKRSRPLSHCCHMMIRRQTTANRSEQSSAFFSSEYIRQRKSLSVIHFS